MKQLVSALPVCSICHPLGPAATLQQCLACAKVQPACSVTNAAAAHFTVADIAAMLLLQFVVESLAKYLPSKRQELTSSEALLVIMLDALQQPCLCLQPAVFTSTKPECFVW